jgi:hypothetical protein
MMRKPRNIMSEEEVVAEFAVRRKRITQLAVLSGVVVGLAILVLYNNRMVSNGNVIAALVVGAVVIVAAFVNVKLWRCPACEGHLGKLYLGLRWPKHCPNCGIALVDA